MTDANVRAAPFDAIRIAKTRQAANRIRGWHHHAVRTHDMTKTREFYEGVLGMPLTGSWVEEYDVIKKTPSNYVHCFFELGDGSALGFFQFQDGMRDEPMPMPRDPYEHHIALDVATIADVKYFMKRLADANHPIMEVDHGYCYSAYTQDPNGMIVEISAIVPDGDRILAEAATTAATDLEAWLDGIRDTNNKWRGTTTIDQS